MIWLETAQFKRLRRKLKRRQRDSLQQAVYLVRQDPLAGYSLRGEFKDLRVLSYTCKGQEKRLVYQNSDDKLVLISFGP
ncbi:MAG: hypothetical protein GQ544_02025 [Candidatus Aminicenantes bacterium]|nr:hypothetical protein [Candidatus Aminicenantes bacterium]